MGGDETGVALLVLAVGAVVVAMVRSPWRFAVLGLALAGAALLVVSCDGGNSCVLAGTMVETPAGPRPIEDLRVGDPVLSLRDDGAVAVSTVAATRTAFADAWLEIEVLGGRTLRVTGSHPLARGGRWVEASFVARGDRLRTPDGEVAVTRVTRRFGRAIVCDLTVVPHANFLASGVLVHNKSYMPDEPTRTELVGGWLGLSGGTRCNIVLHDREPGLLVLWHGDDVRVFRVMRWSLDLFEITLDLEEANGPGRWTVRGHVTARSLRFERGDGVPPGLAEVELFPEWLAVERLRGR